MSLLIAIGFDIDNIANFMSQKRANKFIVNKKRAPNVTLFLSTYYIGLAYYHSACS